MKKIILCIFAFVSVLFLSACGCSKVDYEVVFSNDGNRTVFTVEKGDKVEEPIDPTKDGYIFLGWFRNLTDNEPYDFSAKVSENFVLYAKWEKEKVCNLKCDDGYTLVNPDSKDCKCEKVEEEKEEPKEEQKPQQQTQTTVKYTVKFDSGNGSNISNKLVVSGNKVSAPSNPVKEGYKFLGWYLNDKLFDFNTRIYNNITLIGKWEKIEEPKEEPSTPEEPITPEEPEKEPVLWYKEIEEKGTSARQVRIYLTKDGEIVAGSADIVYINGKTATVDIPKTGIQETAGIYKEIKNIKVK